MNSSLLQKAIRYINKDTSEPNESPKLIVVVRILVLSMLFYIIINSIIYISILNNIGIAILLVSFLMFLGIFIISYRIHTTSVVYTLALCMAAWIVVNLIYFGWNVGVQHFILVLLILGFFRVIRSTPLKRSAPPCFVVSAFISSFCAEAGNLLPAFLRQ